MPTKVYQEAGILAGKTLSSTALVSGMWHTMLVVDNEIFSWGYNYNAETGLDPFMFVGLDTIPAASATPGSVDFTLTHNGSNITNGVSLPAQPDFTGTAEAGRTVIISLDGEEICSAVVAGDTTWSCTPTSLLPVGDYDLEASLYDGASLLETLGGFSVSITATTSPDDPDESEEAPESSPVDEAAEAIENLLADTGTSIYIVLAASLLLISGGVYVIVRNAKRK